MDVVSTIALALMLMTASLVIVLDQVRVNWVGASVPAGFTLVRQGIAEGTPPPVPP